MTESERTERGGGRHHVQIRTPDVPNLIGVDPGEVTGIALYGVRGFTSLELPGVEAATFVMTRARDRSTISRVQIGCERWTNRGRVGRMTSQPRAQLIIGALDEFTRGEEFVTLELQSPGDAKHAVSIEMLKELEWHRPTHGGHANDAAAQVGLLMLRYFPARWYELTHPVQSNTRQPRRSR